VTASTATAALRARRRHHVSHPSPLFTPTEGIELDAISREAIDRQFVLETRRSEPALVADHQPMDSTLLVGNRSRVGIAMIHARSEKLT